MSEALFTDDQELEDLVNQLAGETINPDMVVEMLLNAGTDLWPGMVTRVEGGTVVRLLTEEEGFWLNTAGVLDRVADLPLMDMAGYEYQVHELEPADWKKTIGDDNKHLIFGVPVTAWLAFIGYKKEWPTSWHLQDDATDRLRIYIRQYDEEPEEVRYDCHPDDGLDACDLDDYVNDEMLRMLDDLEDERLDREDMPDGLTPDGLDIHYVMGQMPRHVDTGGGKKVASKATPDDSLGKEIHF